jgi:hypothetical protein
MQPPGAALTRTPPPAPKTPHPTEGGRLADNDVHVSVWGSALQVTGAERVCVRSDCFGGGAGEAGARGAEGPP